MKRHIKLIKTFFEAIKKRSKKKFYSEKLRKFKGYARKTLGVETPNRNLNVMLKFTERPKTPGITSKKHGFP